MTSNREVAVFQNVLNRIKQYDPIAISDPSFVPIRSMIITPTSICPLGPDYEQSNRVLRKYEEHLDRFLRVSFVEENGLKLGKRQMSEEVMARVMLFLEKGTMEPLESHLHRNYIWQSNFRISRIFFWSIERTFLLVLCFK